MKLVKPADCAREAGVSLATIYSNLRSGRLRGYRIGSTGRGTWRIDPGDFELWLQSLRFEDTTPPAPPPAASPASPFSELNPERLRRAWRG